MHRDVACSCNNEPSICSHPLTSLHPVACAPLDDRPRRSGCGWCGRETQQCTCQHAKTALSSSHIQVCGIQQVSHFQFLILRHQSGWGVTCRSKPPSQLQRRCRRRPQPLHRLLQGNHRLLGTQGRLHLLQGRHRLQQGRCRPG